MIAERDDQLVLNLVGKQQNIWVLRQVRHLPADIGDIFMRDVLSVWIFNASGPRAQQSSQAAQQGRFPGAVGSHHHHQLTREQFKIDPPKHRLALYRYVQILHFDQWVFPHVIARGVDDAWQFQMQFARGDSGLFYSKRAEASNPARGRAAG